jgi:hypothetical protein
MTEVTAPAHMVLSKLLDVGRYEKALPLSGYPLFVRITEVVVMEFSEIWLMSNEADSVLVGVR